MGAHDSRTTKRSRRTPPPATFREISPRSKRFLFSTVLLMHSAPTVGRHKPASGVLISSDQPTIVFLTVCTSNRNPWLIEPSVHEKLLDAWTKADAWLIGYYLLMPDHLHLFCAPNKREITLDKLDHLLEAILHSPNSKLKLAM